MLNQHSPNWIDHPVEYRAGQAARQDELDEAECPFPLGSSNHRRWMAGYENPYDWGLEVVQRRNEHFISVSSMGMPKPDIDCLWKEILIAPGANSFSLYPSDNLSAEEIDAAEAGQIWFLVSFNGLIEFDEVRFLARDAIPVLTEVTQLNGSEIDWLLSEKRILEELATISRNYTARN